MDLNPYHTSYGQLVKTKNIEEKILEYLIKTDYINLNYEYISKDCKLVYITGFNDEERDIPNFDQPLILNHRGETTIVADLRPYVTKQQTQPANLASIARDSGNLKYCVLNTLIISDLISGNYGKYKPYNKAIGSSFGFFMGHVLDMIIRLNPIEKVNVEVTAAYYMLHKLYDSSEFSNKDSYKYIKDSIMATLARCKYSIPLQMNAIEGIIGKIEDIEYTGTIDNLLQYLSRQLDNGKEKVLTKQVLINAVSNVWFGHGGSETVLIALEHVPTWMSLLYTIETNSMFKKTRLATIIHKHATQIGLKEYANLMDKDIKAREL